MNNNRRQSCKPILSQKNNLTTCTSFNKINNTTPDNQHDKKKNTTNNNKSNFTTNANTSLNKSRGVDRKRIHNTGSAKPKNTYITCNTGGKTINNSIYVNESVINNSKQPICYTVTNNRIYLKI